MKRGLLSIAILLALPTFASAFNCWSVTRNVMPTGQAGTLVPPPSVAQGEYGYKTIGNVTYVTAATGQDCGSAAQSITFTLTPPAGIAPPVVRIDGVIQDENAVLPKIATGDFPAPTSGVANEYTVAKGTRITHTIQATYAPIATKVAITTVGTAGGYIDRSQTVDYGTDTTISIIPSAGYQIDKVWVGNDARSAAELVGDALAAVKAANAYTFTNPTTNKYLTATFIQIPTLGVYVATANATLAVNQELNLKGAALANMDSRYIAPIYAWTAMKLISVADNTYENADDTIISGVATPNAVFKAASAGIYVVKLTVSAAGVTSAEATRTIKVLSATAAGSNACLSCHETRDRVSGLKGKYESSAHYTSATTVTCSTCHNPSGLLNHPFALATAAASCAPCHPTHPGESVSGNYVALGVNCSGCHDPHSLTKPATALDHTTVGTDSCNDCHSMTQFATSLHATRNGKETFYSHNLGVVEAAPLQKGFGNYVNVPYSALSCGDCHQPEAWTVGGTDTWPGPVCTDCHTNRSATTGQPTTAFNAPVVKATCLGCHSRQKIESDAGLTDVHMNGATNFACKQCHGLSDFHGGEGTEYASQLAAGAVSANCEKCHGVTLQALRVPEHTAHLANIACSTCHMQSVITCYGCHFDNAASDPADSSILHGKFASGMFGGQGAASWRFLVNRVMGDGTTKIYPASMQTLIADRTAVKDATGADDGIENNKGWTHATIAPYYTHSITKTGALKCGDCHANSHSIALAGGESVRVVKWNVPDPGQHVWVGNLANTYIKPSGVIPVPEEPVGKLLMDFADLVYPAAGPLLNGTSPSDRVLFKADGPDSIHMPSEYVRPLTAAQIQKMATPQVRPVEP